MDVSGPEVHHVMDSTVLSAITVLPLHVTEPSSTAAWGVYKSIYERFLENSKKEKRKENETNL